MKDARRSTLEDPFTDEVLSPSRTTRSNADPIRDWAEVIPGDELLVDVTAYRDGGPDGLMWCEAYWPSVGSASVYPYKVRIPDRGSGQYAAAEIHGWRRPVRLHRSVIDAAKAAGRAHAGVRVERYATTDGCEEWVPRHDPPSDGDRVAMCGDQARWLVNGRVLCDRHKDAVDPPSILELPS